MNTHERVTISARVSPRIRQLAKTAAWIQGVTLSRFAAEAVKDAAQRELMSDSTEPSKRTTLAPQSFNTA